MTEDAEVATGCCTGQSWCAVTCTTEVLSRKWHTIIVHKLLSADRLHFNQLKDQIDEISGKVLSESLDDLVDKGIIERDVVQESPRRVEYALSQAGEDLRPVIEAMETWGRAYLDPEPDHVGVGDVFGERAR